MEKLTRFAIIPASSYMGKKIRHAKNMLANGDIPFIRTKSRLFITKEDLEVYMIRNRHSYRDYLRWRIKQSRPIGSSNQERLYYVLWLEEIGVISTRNK